MAALTLAAVATWQHDLGWLLAAAIGAVVWLIFALLHAFEGARCRCATCSGRLFLKTRNAKHSSAHRTLGSYQLHTALGIITSRSYRCQHCGTKVDGRPMARGGSDSASGRRRRKPGQLAGSSLPARRSSPAIVLQAKVRKSPKKPPPER